jgi:hypothetical protein
MLNTANAPSKPTTPPTTNPTRRATTARLFSFNTYLPDTLVHYAPECVEGKFSETEELLFALPSLLIYYPLNEQPMRFRIRYLGKD